MFSCKFIFLYLLIVTDFKAGKSCKAVLHTVKSLEAEPANVTFSSEVQPLNALLYIYLTFSGIIMDFNDLQF